VVIENLMLRLVANQEARDRSSADEQQKQFVFFAMEAGDERCAGSATP